MEIIFILIAEVVFFRKVLFEGALVGDACDGRLTALLTEHWHQVLLGNEKWNELICFYPEKNVISYSDLLLGYAPIHCFFRILGFPYYRAYTYTIFTVHVLGSLLLYYFLRRYVKCSKLISLFGTISFSFALSYQFVMVNTQLVMFSTVPVLLIFIAKYIENANDKKRFLYGGLSALYLVMLFYSAFYVLFFIGIALIIIMLVALVLFPFYMKDDRVKGCFLSLFSRWKEIICYAFGCLLLMLPLLRIYLNTFSEGAGYPWELVEITGINIKDVFVINALDLINETPRGYISTMSIPFALAIIFCIASIVSIKKEVVPYRRFWLFVGLISIIIMFGAIVYVRGFMLWKVVYSFVPGASVIRSLFRWYSIAFLFASIYMSYILDRLLKDCRKSQVIALVLCAIVCISNYTLEGYVSGWNASEEEAFIESVSQPPKGCTTMYITGYPEQNKWINVFINDDLLQQLNSWDIALKYGINTLNGYSGRVPEGWNLIPTSEDASSLAIEWAKFKGIDTKGLFEYNVNTREWKAVSR